MCLCFPTESYDSMTSLLTYDPRQLTSRRGGVGNLSPGTPTLTALLSPSSKKVGRCLSFLYFCRLYAHAMEYTQKKYNMIIPVNTSK